MSRIWIILFILLSLPSWAQEEPPVLTPDLQYITVKQSPSLTLLLEEHRDFMLQLKTLPGYRIQLFTSTRLQEANKFRMEFEKVFPDRKVYIFFNEPSYRVRVGDYTDRIEARHHLEVIQGEYPGAIVVKDQINLEAL